MKKTNLLRLVAAVMLVAVLLSLMTSCLLMGSGNGGNYITKEQLDEALAGQMAGNVNVDNVNDYDIVINNSGNPNLTAAAKGVLSTVRVIASYTTNNPYTGSSLSSAEGAGVIYKLDKLTGSAYIITNYHVVYNSRAISSNYVSNDIQLRLYGMDDEKYNIPATYVGGSMTLDLAVLKVTGSRVLAESNAMAATVANSDGVAILDTAIAIGNPAAAGISATVGCINVDGEYINMTAADGTTIITLRLFRIDTPVNSGNSGGGLYNEKGELIGIVNAKLSSSTIDSIGYAIPSNVAKYAADNIIAYCDGTDLLNPYKKYIGINMKVDEMYTEYNASTGKVYKREIVTIDSITEGSAADGHFQVGDVIKEIRIDGKTYEINRMYQVIDCMYNILDGSSLTVVIERDGLEKHVRVPLSDVEATRVP